MAGRENSGAATGAAGVLFSHAGAGPAPARRDKDRPAQDGAGEADKERTGIETNAGKGKEAAAPSARRLSLLLAFIGAGRRLVRRMVGIGALSCKQGKEAKPSEKSGIEELN
jgi:hypothetical protein